MKAHFKIDFKKAKNKLLDLLFPKGLTCVNCGAEITSKTRLNLCAKCTEALPEIKGHRCITCGVPILNEADYCDNCQRFDKYFEKMRAPLIYDGVAKDMLRKLKFGNKRYIAEEFSKMMADEYIDAGFLCDIILYVPMTDKEVKERGFNQSELLAKGVAERLNIPLSDTLKKIKDSNRQKDLTAKQRRENLKGVFAVLDKEVVKSKNVLIIDDVYTTGATINECSRIVKQAGARRVFALTAVQTVFKVEGEKLSDKN